MNSLARFIVVLLACLPTAAMAETFRVRSGEHEGFTRLVIDFREREDWVFGRVDGGFEFRPFREDIGYQLGRVYDKIGRKRISEVTDLGQGRLFVAVDCHCHAVTSALADGKVVIDIASGPAPQPGVGADAVLPPIEMHAAREAGFTEEEPAVSVQAEAARPVVVSDRAGLPLTFPRAGGEKLPLAPGPVAEGPAPDPDTSGQATLAETDDRETRIARTETVLLEQIARAAAQGLLEADMSEIEASVAGARPQTPAAAPRPAIAPPRPPVTRRGHIAVETGVDRAVAGGNRKSGETAEGEACMDPAYFQIADWGGEVANGANIGAYRSHIVGEFDIADSEHVTALARNYVYITFGAEAKALLRQYPGSVERADLLFAMAEIMDDGHSTQAETLVEQMGCDGATALWATLAQRELHPGQTINRDAVTLAFGALPPHLRRHLGPDLADKLLAAGDRDTAELIRAAIDRAGAAADADAGLLSARFDAEDGRIEQAEETLDAVLATGDPVLPEALLQRVETTLAAGGAVPDDIIVLLDGMAFQFRGTDLQRQMTDAGIRARASISDFAAAFDQLETAQDEGLFTAERAVALRGRLFERLTQDAATPDFLRLSLPRLDTLAGISGNVRHLLAGRFLELGLTGPARRVLSQNGALPAETGRLQLARAALMERKPAVAIGYLAGFADAEAERLRAEALDLARDHDGAVLAFESLGEADRALQAAWRGGLWSEVATRDQGPLGAAAQLMAKREAASSASTEMPADQPPLGAAQALIDNSRATRETLEALLETIAAPAGGETPVSPD